MSGILCVNGGSSSLKVALYGRDEARVSYGQARRIGSEAGIIEWNGRESEPLGSDGHADAMRRFAGLMDAFGAPAAIGHRIVHGGDVFDGPRRLTPEVLTELRRLAPLAPLHLPVEILLLETCAELWPEAAQVLCFDTAFHRSMPKVARRLPIPRPFAEGGVRRYGFHGISYEYVLGALGNRASGRLVLAHLGAGASLAAVRDGRPVDTTMGFTPAGGLMMAARCGDLDPGVIVYLMREKGYGPDEIDRLVNEESGLLGVSGQTGDMAKLLSEAENDADAREAIESFCWIARKHIGSMAAALGGLDTLVFTGGVGENAPAVRAAVCDGLGHLGVELDSAANARNEETISSLDSRCGVFVVPTNEELQIARAAIDLSG